MELRRQPLLPAVLLQSVLALALCCAGGQAGLLDSQLSAGGRLSALASEHTALRGALTDAVNQILSHTRHPCRLATLAGQPQPRSEDEQCVTDLHRWADAFNASETWALRMADSTSKFVTGVLYGQNGDLGNFDECVEATPGNLGSGDDFTGLYALPTITFLRYPKQANASSSNSLVDLRIALCAPNSCSARFLQEAVTSQLLPVANSLIESHGVQLDFSLTAERTSQYSGYRTPDSLDWAIVSLTVLLVVIVIIATTIDLWLGCERLKAASGWGPRLVVAFSGRINGKKLVTVGPSGGDMLGCVHGIRTLSMLWIVQGHRWSRDIQAVPRTNYNSMSYYAYGNYAFTAFVLDAILSVDTFFVVGGIVNSYVFLKSVRKTNSFNVLQYYIHRYIRLAPSFMFIIGVSATWVSLIGNGPTWYSVAGHSQECRRAWWTHLLFLGNYVKPENQCHVLWYPNADMQLYWVSPLVLLPLWRRPRLGVLWLLCLIVASCLLPLGISIAKSYRFIIPMLGDSDNTFLWEDMYWPAHMRATPYFVGMLTGYILYLIKVEKRNFKLNKLQTLAGWLVSSVICVVVLLGACPLYDDPHVAYSKLASDVYIGLSRVAWSAGLSWIVVACATGHGCPVNAFLSWTPFAVIGRLTYGIYLTHNPVQQVDQGLDRAAEFVSPFKMTHSTVADFFFATILAAGLSIMLESPVILLEKWLWESKAPKKIPEKKETA